MDKLLDGQHPYHIECSKPLTFLQLLQPNAGGSSTFSEVLSFEVLRLLCGACNVMGEMELDVSATMVLIMIFLQAPATCRELIRILETAIGVMVLLACCCSTMAMIQWDVVS